VGNPEREWVAEEVDLDTIAEETILETRRWGICLHRNNALGGRDAIGVVRVRG